MPIHLEFTLTFEEYLQALRLHAKRDWRGRLNWVIADNVSPLIGILFILFALRQFVRDKHWLVTQHSLIPWALLLMVTGAGLFLMQYPFQVRRRIKRYYTLASSDCGNCMLDIGREKIRAERKNAKSEIDWGALSSYAENEKLLMFYFTRVQFFAIPKRVCTENQVDELRNLFREKIGDAKIAAVTE